MINPSGRAYTLLYDANSRPTTMTQQGLAQVFYLRRRRARDADPFHSK